MRLDEWLKKNLARFAELVAVNNNTPIIDGVIGESRVVGAEINRYGRVGLTIQEAFELTYLRGGLDAVSVTGDALKIRAAVEREILGRLIEVPSAEVREQLLSKSLGRT